ncbi:hypothetical protein [Mesobacillus foraminis]|nr:hypothetical protein [Mesobacillus foraminis]
MKKLICKIKRRYILSVALKMGDKDTSQNPILIVKENLEMLPHS